MTTVTVVVATASQELPAGPAPAGIIITIDGIAPVTVAAAPYQAVFDNVAPGTYTATAQAVDVNGAHLGAPATSAPFTIAAPTMAVDIPQSITVTVG